MQKLNPRSLSAQITVFLFATVTASTAAFAQEGDDAPIDIDFGSTRIGGTGLTESERRASAWEPEDEELPTEDNIPEIGSPKRLPHLHILAKRYTTGGMWKEACARYDQIIEEGSDEGLASTEDGKKLAAKSYLKCAEMKGGISHVDAAERLLLKSERYFGKADYRHQTIRRKMLRDQYRKKILNRDVEGGIAMYKKLQSTAVDENERIWLGDKLSQMAEEAYRLKDKELMARYIAFASDISPRNPVLRRLKKRIHNEERAIPIAVGGGVACVLIVLFFAWFGRWRGRRKIAAVSGGPLPGKKNKYMIDDLD